MRVEQFSFRDGQWSTLPDLDSSQTLVLLFADPEYRQQDGVWGRLFQHFPKAAILGCSTSGNICGLEVLDGSVEAVAIHFERTQLKQGSAAVAARDLSFEAGRDLAKAFDPAGLRALFVLSDGLLVNGTELLRGLSSELPEGVAISGGLAGDGSRFQTTWTMTRDFRGSGRVCAVGLYGDHVEVSYGSQGGWSKFGIERLVTRSAGPVLYELDGQPALHLYRQYLGDKAAGLPATGLLFPLAIREEYATESVVRTILQIDEAEQSLTFAGDIPQGSRAQLMKANLETLVEGASLAAEAAWGPEQKAAAQTRDLHALAIAVSCVGRRLVLKARVDEELEAVQTALPDGATQIGFYSYGEIAPNAKGKAAQLHNQTMTVTLLRELEVQG